MKSNGRVLNEKGLTTAFSEILLLALSIVIVSSAGLFWLNLAIPSEKVKLEIVGSNGTIGIYDVAGVLDCRKVKIILQDRENLTIVEIFKFSEEKRKFVGSPHGWKSVGDVPTFLNPGDCIVLRVDPGDYLITIADQKGILAQSLVRC